MRYSIIGAGGSNLDNIKKLVIARCPEAAYGLMTIQHKDYMNWLLRRAYKHGMIKNKPKKK